MISSAFYLGLLIFCFNDTTTTEIYTLSLHDALPISAHRLRARRHRAAGLACAPQRGAGLRLGAVQRSEEHTSELQSHSDLVCRLLLEKKNHKSRLAR